MANAPIPPTAEIKSAPQFVGIGTSVMRGAENIAMARSATMAHRIAEALNRYLPGSRGY